MYSVSLLPNHYILQNQARKRKDKLLKISLIAMCVLFAVYSAVLVVHTAKNNELKTLQKENQMVMDQISSLEDLTALNNSINEIYNIAKKAAGNNPSWEKIIVDIGNSVPETIGIISMELSYKDGTGTGRIQGLALDHNTVSAWLKSLSELSDISDIKCSFSTQTQEDAEDFVKFEVTMSLKPGSGYEIPGGNGV
ncbi:MAG: PilN domain-containing protein [Clostridiaceae bacterium]|nr:PilN domain-containing protein [Clostridiaceae bacterium]